VVTDPQTNTQTHKSTNKQTSKQTGPITIHCAAKLSAQYNNDNCNTMDDFQKTNGKIRENGKTMRTISPI